MEIIESIQDTAYSLYDSGLNIFPVHSKYPTDLYASVPFHFLSYERIHRSQIPKLFAQPYPIGVYAGNRSHPYFFFIKCKTQIDYEYQKERIKEAGLPIWASRMNDIYYIWFRSSYGRVQEKISPNSRVNIYGKHTYLIAPSDAIGSSTWVDQEGSVIPLVQPYKKLRWLDLERECPAEKNYFEDGKNNIEKDKTKKPRSSPVYRSEAATIWLQHHYDWHGKQGITDFKVICGILYRIIKYEERSITFRGAQREIATYACINKKTVNQSFKRLKEQNIISLVREQKSMGHEYKFSNDLNRKGRKFIKKVGRNGTLSLYLFIHSMLPNVEHHPFLLEREALGWHGLYVYDTISQIKPRALTSIAEYTRFSYDEVKRLVKRLELFNLVDYSDSSYRIYPITQRHIDNILNLTDAELHHLNRLQEHQKDRQLANGDRIEWYFRNNN
jgi:hypothetical protein